MVDKSIKAIYDNTFNIVLDVLGEEKICAEKYWAYLLDKYARLLEEFISEESEETVQAIVESYIDDEVRLWSGLNKAEMISILDKDSAYEHLKFLSEIAFEQAKKCLKTESYLQDDTDYEKRLKEIADCLDSIKPQNIDAAKELVSESVLDLDFIYQKSRNKSLRLSRIM